jgi:hypothetical protein
VSSVSNGLYLLTLSLVSVARFIIYIKRNVEEVWGARYTLGARYLLKNTVYIFVCLLLLEGRRLCPEAVFQICSIITTKLKIFALYSGSKFCHAFSILLNDIE